MKTIILINGVARSGKDTFAEMLIPYLCPYVHEDDNKTGIILPNAFGVKEIARNVYGWDGEKDERGRGLLLDVTKTGYNYDPMFWEKVAVSHLKQLEIRLNKRFDFVVVPDFRYPVTQRYYMACGYNTITIQVTRPDHDNELGIHKNDVSEQDLGIEFDYHVVNDSTIEDLDLKAREVAKSILVKCSDINKGE